MRTQTLRRAGVLCLLVFLERADAQPRPGISKVQELLARAGLTLAAPLVASKESLEVRVRWNAYLTDERHVTLGGAPPGSGFVPVSMRRVPEPPLVARSPQLARDQLLVVGTDAQATVRWWQLIGDPRLVRHEAPQASGQLGGRSLHQTHPEFSLSLPADPLIVSVRFYELVWSGGEFTLQWRGAMPLPAAER